MPGEYIHQYTIIYTVIGGVGAFLFFLIYTNTKALSMIKAIGVFLLAICGCIFLSVESFFAAMLIYPVLLIFNDYISSQGFSLNLVRKYRLLLILSVIPFLMMHDSFQIFFLGRVFILLAAMLFFVVLVGSVDAIPITSTPKYMFFNYTFYYVPIFLISNVVQSPQALKVWYIFAQGGLVLYLKYLDFSMRKNHSISGRIEKFILGACLFSPFIPMWFFQNFFAFSLYYIGLFGLFHSRNYVQR